MVNQFNHEKNSLDAKIKKEIKANEGGTVWRDRKARLLDCVAQKKSVMPSRDVWEENYTKFEAYQGIPKRDTKEYNWMVTQLNNKNIGLDAKIKGD
jgi:hypothetical protein